MWATAAERSPRMRYKGQGRVRRLSTLFALLPSTVRFMAPVKPAAVTTPLTDGLHTHSARVQTPPLSTRHMRITRFSALHALLPLPFSMSLSMICVTFNQILWAAVFLIEISGCFLARFEIIYLRYKSQVMWLARYCHRLPPFKR
jgi:hypothetical protein